MSLRRIVNTDVAEVVISDDMVVYERTDLAALNWNVGSTPPAEKEILVCNNTGNPFDLNMLYMSQCFASRAGGLTSSLTVSAYGSMRLKFDGRFPWFLVGEG